MILDGVVLDVIGPMPLRQPPPAQTRNDDSLVIRVDRKSDFIVIPSGFSRCHHVTPGYTYLPVGSLASPWLVLSFRSSLFAGPVAIGMGALRHDGDR